jgi:hypothetical protein
MAHIFVGFVVCPAYDLDTEGSVGIVSANNRTELAFPLALY